MSKSNGSMNRVFRVIWNAAKSVWQAVAEIATGYAKCNTGSAARADRREARWAVVAAGTWVILALPLGAAQAAPAPNELPTGGTVVGGSATISSTSTPGGARMDVLQTTQRTAIDWQTFNIGSAAHVHFQQPAGGAALNRVLDTNASQIYGKLTATGQVFLLNPNGVLFAPGSQVDVGGIVASTLNLSNENFMAGNYRFEGSSSSAIINQGNIKVTGDGTSGGTAAFIAAKITNTGTIDAPKGNVLMGAGSKVTLDLGGPVKLQVEQGAIDALIESGGAIKAEGGTVLLSAKAAGDLAATVINHTGLIEAQTLATGENGQITLLGEGGEVKVAGTLDASAPSVANAAGTGGKIVATGKTVTLEDSAYLNASGKDGGGTVLVGGSYQNSDPSVYQATTVNVAKGARIDVSATEVGAGGTAVVWSDITNAESITRFDGTITAQGGKTGGDGGQVETSGATLIVGDNARVNTVAQSSSGNAGTWLLDPTDFSINAGTGAQTTSSIGATTLQNNLASGNVSIATSDSGAGSGNMAINAPLTWGIYKLTLTAHGWMKFWDSGANINGTGTSSLELTAKGGPITFNGGTITTGGTQIYNGNVVLGTNVTFATTNSDITFNGKVDGTTAGTQALTINQGTKDVWFKGAVGGSTSLASLSVNGTGNALVGWDNVTNTNGTTSTSSGGVITSGAQTYNGNLLVGGTNTALTTTNGAVTVMGNINSYRSGIHTGVFTSTAGGTFTPFINASNVTLLVVGGGGGGGSGGQWLDANGKLEAQVGGGGGAGGVYYTTTQSLTSGTGYTITVGAGGGSNTMGGQSSFSGIVAGGGAFGTRWYTTQTAPTLATGLSAAGYAGGVGSYYNGSSDGSGTGGSWKQATVTSYVTPQYGGNTYAGGNYAVGSSGGGAGAGGSGSNATTNSGGAGGNGVAFTIAGATYSVAAGGGGANSTVGAGGTVNGVTIGGTGGYNTTGGSASGYGSGGGGAKKLTTGSYPGGGSGSAGLVVVSYNFSNLSDATNLTINSGSGKVDIRGTVGNTRALGTLTVNSTATDNTVSGTLSGSTAFTYNGTNLGVLTLSGANTHSGANTISGGTLKLGNTGALGSGTVTVGSAAASTASLDLNGLDTAKAMTLHGYGAGGTSTAGTVGALTNSSATAVTATGNLTLGTAATVGSSFGNINLGGTISGAYVLTKVGTDTVTLTKNNNSYSGGTTLRAGTLVVPTTGSMGSGALNLGGSGTLDLQKVHTASSLSSTGGIIVNSSSDASSLTVTGTSSLAGSITTKGTQTYTGAVTLIGNATFTSNDNDITFGSTVSGFSNFTVNQGTGKATFNGVVGSTALASLSVTGSGATWLGNPNAATATASVTTTGAQTYAGDLVLAADSVSLTTTNSAVSVAGSTLSSRVITTSGSAVITSTGTTSWTAPADLAGNVTMLLVGGGGGGGSATGVSGISGAAGGGGGGGGYYYSASQAITAGSTYTVKVGAGGASNTAGGYSQFDTIRVGGGGAGSSSAATAAAPATSCGGTTCTYVGYAGGGGEYYSSGWLSRPRASSSSPQFGGTAYVAGDSGASTNAGGGAGAGGSGTSSTASGVAGNGGAGTSYTISGTSYTFGAGGGGGGVWGAGGGGSGIGGSGGATSGAAGGNATGYGAGGGGGSSSGANSNTYNGGTGSNGLIVIGWSNTTTGNAGANLTINSGSGQVSMGAANNMGNVSITSTATNSKVDGVISGTGNLTYAGTQAGVLSLNAANTYTGTTTVSGGTLKLGVADAIASTSAFTVGSASTSTASLDLNGFSTSKALTLNGYGAGGSSGNIGALTNSSTTAATASGAIALNSGSFMGGVGDINLTGIVSGTGLLTKVGSGALTLSNSANSYSGGTTIKAGTLVVPSTGSMSSSGTLTISGGTLDLQKTQTIATLSMTGGSITNSSSDASSLAVTGTSTLAGSVTTRGTQTYTGATTLGAAATLTSNNNDITFGNTVNGGFGLTVAQGSGKATFNGIVGGTTALASLSVTGSGATWLGSSTSGVTTAGAQTYAGDLYLGNANTSLTTTNSAITIGGAVNSYIAKAFTEEFKTTTRGTSITSTWVAPTNIVGDTTVLVVGGGGGGGFLQNGNASSTAKAGGGGGGGVYLGTLALTGGTSYNIRVGAGGSGTPNTGSLMGDYSQFGSYTAGGGGGGNYVNAYTNYNTAGVIGPQTTCGGATCSVKGNTGGGSGTNNSSGASWTVLAPASGGSGGGGTAAASYFAAGGGGGAGGVGGSATSATGGAGGAGTSVTVNSTTYLVSAGGGGAGNTTGQAGPGGTVTVGGTTTTIGGAGAVSINAGGNAQATGYGSGGGGASTSGYNTSLYMGGMGADGIVVVGYSTSGNAGANLTISSGSGQVSMNAANNMGNVSITSTATNSKVDGVISGTGNLTYAGTQAGVLALNAANTYTGTTSVTGGTLKLGAGGTAGAGAITVGSAATSTASLDLNGQAITNAINLNGYGAGGNGGTVGALTNSGADVALAASTAVTLATASTIGGNNGKITLANALGGTNVLTKVGSNTLTLTGVSTYTGATTISGGTLQIGGAGSLNSGSYAGAISIASGASFQYSSSAAQTLSGVISGAGNLVKDTGTSTLTLSSASNSYTGSTTVNAGKLLVSGSLGSGTYAGAINLGADGTLEINKSSSQTLSGVISGGGRLTKYSSGTLILNGANTYTGGTTLATGTLQAGTNTAFGTGDIAVTSSGSGATLDLYGKTIANNVSVTGHGIGGSTGSTGAIISSTASTGKLTGNVTLTGETSIGNNTNDFEISGVISGAFKLNKLGGNTVTLSGLNTYSGGTDVENNSSTPGILKAGSSQAFGDSTGLVTVVSGSAVDLNGQTIGNAFSVAGTGVSNGGVIYNSNTTTAGTATGNITMTADSSFGGAGNLSLTGVVSGAFNLTKTGAGILTLGGANANTYTGTTTVSTGTLKLGHASGLGNATSAVTITGGTTLDLNGYTLARNLLTSSAGVGSNGGLINSNTSTSGGVTGTVTLGGGSPSFGGAGNFSISGAVSGGYSVTKVGAGEVSLNGLNTYTFGTTISGGTLKIGGSGNLTAGTYAPTISIASGATFKYSSSADQRIDGVISGAGNVVKDTSTSSRLTLYTQTNTYTGSTSIQAGTLRIASATSLNGTSSITVGSDATSLATLDLWGYSPNLGSRSLVLNGYGVGGATGSVGAIGSTSGNSTLYADNISFGSDVRIGGSYNLTMQGSTVNLGIGGGNALTKVGAGVLTVTGNSNTYNGNVKVNEGTLELNGNFASGSNIDIASGATLKYTSSSNGSLNGVISGAGDLRLTTGATLTLGGTAPNTFTGFIVADGDNGTIKAGKTNAFGASAAMAMQLGTKNTNVFDVNGQTLANQFRLRGWGVGDIGSLINSNTSAAGTVSGVIQLDANTLIGGAGTLNLTNYVWKNTSNFNLVFVGAGAKNLPNEQNSLNLIASGAGIGALTVNSLKAINVGGGIVINGITYNGINTNNAAVTLTSGLDTGTNGNSGAAIYNTHAISTGTGDVTLTANTFGANANYIGTGVLTLRPYTAGREMTLMGTTLNPTPSQLVLDATSLSYLTNSYNATNWSKVVFGSSTTGNMSVIQQLTINSSSMEVITAGNIGMAAKLTSNLTNGTITVRAASIGSGPNGGIVQSGTNGTWMVYLPTVVSGDNTNYPNSFNNLNSQNKAIWGQTYSSLSPTALIAAKGNGGGTKGYFVFAEAGTAVADVGNLTKTYGTDNSADLPGTLTYSGTAMTALANVYLANTAADVIDTAPTVSSAGTAQRAAKGTYDITASGGTAKSGYSLSIGTSGTMTVNPKALNVTGASGVDKTYDGTTNVTSNGSYAITSADIVSGDTVTVSGATVYDTKDAGARTVQQGSLTLGGTDAGNYTLTWTNGSGTIAKKALTVTPTGDAKFLGDIDNLTAGATYSGFVAGETSSVVSGSVVITRDGAGTVEGAGTYPTALSASTSTLSATNYSFNYQPGSFTIVPAGDLLVKAGSGTASYGSAGTYSDMTVQYKNGSNVLVPLTLTNQTGNTFTFSDGLTGSPGGAGGATFTLSAGGAGDLSGAGLLKVGSYSVSGTNVTKIGNNFTGGVSFAGTLAVTPLAATLQTSSVTKTYDGTTSANGGATVSNLKTNDVVTVSGVGGFADKNVGTGKSYTMTGLTLAGADADNYYLASTTASGTGNITAKTITASYTGTDKVYDRSTAATVSGSSAGMIVGDNLVFNQTGATFDNKNVGTGKTITVTGISLDGTDKDNYELSSTGATTTANITAKAITISGITAGNKTYDGATTATVDTSAATGWIAGDNIGLSATGVFDNKNVGTGKTVTLTSGYNGADAGNYTITNQASTTANITPKAITVAYTGVDKVYDRTTTASVTGSAADKVAGDSLSFSQTATFDAGWNVGTNKAISISGIMLGGGDAGNYSLNNTTATATANITAKTLSTSYTGTNKVYDGTTATTASGSLVGVMTGDEVTLSDSGASFATKNAGTAKTVNITGLTLGGADVGNYQLGSTSTTTTADITKKSLTVAYTGTDKTYDGTTAATVSSSTGDVISGDVVNISQTSATFDTKNAGTGKTITVSGISLGGTDGGNYALAATTATTTADITAKAITVAYTGSDKVYDGNATATVTASSLGLIGGDAVGFSQTALFADKNAGASKVVSVSNIALTGADAGNYTVANGGLEASAIASITKRALTVAYTATDRVYDQTTAVTVTGTGAAKVAGDDLTYSQTASFADKNAGANKTVSVSNIELAGGDKDNYSLQNTTATTTATITPKALSVGYTGTGKTYDGTTTTTVTVSSSGVYSGDTVNISQSAAFADKTAGNSKLINVTGITLTGADAGNYSAASTATTNADIAKKDLTATYTGQNKVYDGLATASVTGASTDIIAGDAVSFTQSAEFVVGGVADKNVGNGKSINVSSIALAGGDANNYNLQNTTATTSASITKKALTVSYTGSDKVYDATTTATVTGSSTDKVGGDTLSYTQTAVFADKNVGAGKNISITGITLDGADKDNYALQNTTAMTSASIGKATLNVTGASAQDKTYDGTTVATITGAAVAALGSDDVTLNTGTASFASKNAGTHAVSTAYTVSGADAGNYTLVQPVGLSATINKKTLTVTANDDAKFFGQTDTAGFAGVSYSGFVAGETANEISTAPTVARLAGFTTQDAGTYAGKLVSSGGNATNYDFSHVPGKLTIVGPNTLLIKASNSLTYGSAVSFNSDPLVQYFAGVDASNPVSVVTLTKDTVSGATYTYKDSGTGTVTFTLGASGAVNSTAGKLTVGTYAVTGSGVPTFGGANNFSGTPTYIGNLTVTPLQVQFNTGSMSKVYDGTTTATGTVTPSNLQTNDVVSIGYSSGVFASKNVGSNVAFTLNGLNLSGADAGNYFLATSTDSGTGAITAKDITVTYTGVNKVYNGNTTATVIGASSGLIAGDAVGFSQTADFADKNVGTGKSIAISGIALTGTDAGNYNVINTGGLASASADITRKNLTASFAGTNKTYDGTTAATVTGSSADMVAGDSLSYTQTAAFADKNAGTGKLVNVTGIALTGSDAGNYALQSTTATTTANIDKKALTASYTAINRTYDGTTSIAVTGGSTDIVSGDTVNFSETAALASKAAGNGRTVNVSNIALSGTDGGNYALTATTTTTTADIAKKSLTASYTAANKTYDGLTTATVTGVSTDVVAGDAVTFGQTANFANKNAGSGKSVSITGITLGGADGANYELTATTAGSIADIAKKAITVAYAGTNKTYDGTTSATVTGSSADKVTGDNLSYTQTAAFADKNAGAAKLVNVSAVALAGTDAGNYDLQNTTASTTANIAQKALTASYTATDRTYDGTTGVTVSGSSSDIITNDVVNFSQSAVLASKNAGTQTVNISNIALAGADAGNYALQSTTATTTANIAKATLTGITGITASNKTYDGNATATLVTGSAVLAGKIGGDNLTIGSASGSFADKHVGSGKTVMISNVVLGGTDAGNYNTFTDPLSTTADITARTLTVGWTASNKVYDGNATATVTNTDNRVANDVLTVDYSPATFANKNVANGKVVTIGGIALSGTDAGNYTVAGSATTTANISAKALTLTLAGSPTKVYDGTTAFALGGVTPMVDGKVTNDDLTVGTGNVTGFADKNVGTNKAVTFTGFGLTGIDASNYSLVSGTAQSNASITAATISGVTGITAANKVYDGGTVATLNTTGAGFTGRIGSDVLTVATATGAFADKNVANGKTVSISGITLSGADAGNYVLANDTATATANITPKTLTVTYTGVNKVYDAGLGATVTTSDDRLGSDVLTIARTATFDNTGGTGKNVGTGKAINVTGVSLSGTDAVNYSVSATGTATADITAKAITISGITAANKVYDRGVTATASTAGAGGWIAGDNVSVTATGVFGDKNVGTSKTVTLTSSYSGADMGNYTITDQATTTANITPKTITISGITAANKEYDRTTSATIDTSNASGWISGDNIGLSATGTFSDKNVANGKAVTLTSNYSGADAGNYTITDQASTTANITAKAITISGITAANKTYDALRDATVSTAGASGWISGDNIGLTATGLFDTKHVGNGKTVTLTSSYGGPDAGNYTITDQASTTADVVARGITISGLTATSRLADGTTNAALSGTPVVTPLAGDNVTLLGVPVGAFADANPGTAKPVTVTGLSLAGNDAGNYLLQPLTGLVADITAPASGNNPAGAAVESVQSQLERPVLGSPPRGDATSPLAPPPLVLPSGVTPLILSASLGNITVGGFQMFQVSSERLAPPPVSAGPVGVPGDSTQTTLSVSSKDGDKATPQSLLAELIASNPNIRPLLVIDGGIYLPDSLFGQRQGR